MNGVFSRSFTSKVREVWVGSQAIKAEIGAESNRPHYLPERNENFNEFIMEIKHTRHFDFFPGGEIGQ